MDLLTRQGANGLNLLFFLLGGRRPDPISVVLNSEALRTSAVYDEFRAKDEASTWSFGLSRIKPGLWIHMMNWNGLNSYFLLWDQGLAPFSLLVTKLARSSKPLSLLLENITWTRPKSPDVRHWKTSPYRRRRKGAGWWELVRYGF